MLTLVLALATASANPVHMAAPQLDTLEVGFQLDDLDPYADPAFADDLLFLDASLTCDPGTPLCVDGIVAVARATVVDLPDGSTLVRVVDLAAPVNTVHVHAFDGMLQVYGADDEPEGAPMQNTSGGGWVGWLGGLLGVGAEGGIDIDITIRIPILSPTITVINSGNDSNSGNDNSNDDNSNTEEDSDDTIDDGTDSGAGDGHADGGAGGGGLP